MRFNAERETSPRCLHLRSIRSSCPHLYSIFYGKCNRNVRPKDEACIALGGRPHRTLPENTRRCDVRVSNFGSVVLSRKYPSYGRTSGECCSRITSSLLSTPPSQSRLHSLWSRRPLLQRSIAALIRIQSGINGASLLQPAGDSKTQGYTPVLILR